MIEEDPSQSPLILVTGATGLVGKQLCLQLATQGYNVLALSRSLPDPSTTMVREKIGHQSWLHPERTLPSLSKDQWRRLAGVVHLAGEPVAGRRWTAEQKTRIEESRVRTTENLVQALHAEAGHRPPLICASAVGIYGNRGAEVLDEEAEPGVGFLADVCKRWEGASGRYQGRVVQLRFGVILSNLGGALTSMLPAFRVGAGGSLGSGQQYFPWVHLDDVVAIIQRALKEQTWAGPLNVVAPQSVQQKDFAKALGTALGRPTILPTPEFALTLLFGEGARVLLDSQRAFPHKAIALGYRFKFSDLKIALEDLISR